MKALFKDIVKDILPAYKFRSKTDAALTVVGIPFYFVAVLGTAPLWFVQYVIGEAFTRWQG